MATSAWNQGLPVPSTTWPFLMRISAWAAGGTCASRRPAPPTDKSATPAAARPRIVLRRIAMICPPAADRFSLLGKYRQGNPRLAADAAHTSRSGAPLSRTVLSDTKSRFRNEVGSMDRRHLLKNSLALGGLAGLGSATAR